MDEKILGAIALLAVWLVIVYSFVAIMIFWDAVKRDRDILSMQVVGRNLVRSLLWIREIFR